MTEDHLPSRGYLVALASFMKRAFSPHSIVLLSLKSFKWARNKIFIWRKITLDVERRLDWARGGVSSQRDQTDQGAHGSQHQRQRQRAESRDVR